ncbi:MAG: hypothetical protein NC339_07495 [Muribaculaceae bacterium]|nr:hypothetical protein [Muribaculaceae bacterium]
MNRLYLLIMIALCTVFAAVADTPYMEAVEEADKACAKGEWLKALASLDRALELEPDNPGNILLMSNIGLIQFNMGQDSLAVATLNEAHRLAPRSVTILANRARVLTAMGSDDEALADYELIMQLDSLDTQSRFNHGLLSLRHRKFAAAKDDVEWLNLHNPDTDETRIITAALHCSLGEYAEAIPLYTNILRNIKASEYYGARAYCYLMTGELQDASNDIARALELSPDDGELYLYRAALNKMRFRPDDARADAKRAVELGVDRRRAAEFLK